MRGDYDDIGCGRYVIAFPKRQYTATQGGYDVYGGGGMLISID